MTSPPRYARLIALLATLPLASAHAAAAEVTSEMKAQAKAVARACGGDYKRLCSAVKFGGGRVSGCLQEHRADLAPACRTELSRAEALKAKADRAQRK